MFLILRQLQSNLNCESKSGQLNGHIFCLQQCLASSCKFCPSIDHLNLPLNFFQFSQTFIAFNSCFFSDFSHTTYISIPPISTAQKQKLKLFLFFIHSIVKTPLPFNDQISLYSVATLPILLTHDFCYLPKFLPTTSFNTPQILPSIPPKQHPTTQHAPSSISLYSFCYSYHWQFFLPTSHHLSQASNTIPFLPINHALPIKLFYTPSPSPCTLQKLSQKRLLARPLLPDQQQFKKN